MSGAREVTFEVYGTPVPQGSKSGFTVPKAGGGHRVVIAEGGSKKARAGHKDWRSAVSDAARDWAAEHDPFPLLDGPLLLTVGFRFARPVSYPKWRWLHASKPDLDKLVRSVGDSLSKLLIAEDSRIAVIVAWQQYVTERGPGATIHLKELTEAERVGRLVIPGFALERDDPSGDTRLPLPG